MMMMIMMICFLDCKPSLWVRISSVAVRCLFKVGSQKPFYVCYCSHCRQKPFGSRWVVEPFGMYSMFHLLLINMALCLDREPQTTWCPTLDIDPQKPGWESLYFRGGHIVGSRELTIVRCWVSQPQWPFIKHSLSPLFKHQPLGHWPNCELWTIMNHRFLGTRLHCRQIELLSPR